MSESSLILLFIACLCLLSSMVIGFLYVSGTLK